MRTQVVKIQEDAGSGEAIRVAAKALVSGGLVAFPTETVYGLGANVADRQAMTRLRQVKGRTKKKPFTVHIGRRDDVSCFVPDMPRLGRRLVAKGWPGPLMLVFHVESPESAPVMKDLETHRLADIYYEGTVGIRCPSDPTALAFLSEASVPVVAASANLAGNPPPVTGDEVLDDLDGKIDLLLDAGRVRYAQPSTIVRLNGNGYEILRKGVFDARMIRRLSTTHILFVCTGNTCRSPMAAALCRQRLADRHGCRTDELDEFGYEIHSAGVFAMSGGQASVGAIHALEERGIDLSNHVSQPLTVELIHQADYIYTMTSSHLDTVVSMVPNSADRAATIKTDGDVADPVGSGDEVYRQCARTIDEAIQHRLAEIAL